MIKKNTTKPHWLSKQTRTESVGVILHPLRINLGVSKCCVSNVPQKASMNVSVYAGRGIMCNSLCPHAGLQKSVHVDLFIK